MTKNQEVLFHRADAIACRRGPQLVVDAIWSALVGNTNFVPDEDQRFYPTIVGGIDRNADHFAQVWCHTMSGEEHGENRARRMLNALSTIHAVGLSSALFLRWMKGAGPDVSDGFRSNQEFMPTDEFEKGWIATTRRTLTQVSNGAMVPQEGVNIFAHTLERLPFTIVQETRFHLGRSLIEEGSPIYDDAGNIVAQDFDHINPQTLSVRYYLVEKVPMDADVPGEAEPLPLAPYGYGATHYLYSLDELAVLVVNAAEMVAEQSDK